ncbi:MAG: NAD-dependent epimerase/dehydratase family protein [Ignavibacteria bacterium]|jgi:UDP-glucose 4-epimerase
MNILVTGGAGFIGSHIVDRYIKDGHKVIILDNLSTGYSKNINPKAIFYKIDICSKKIEEIFKKHKIDVLNHHAAQVDLRLSLTNPQEDAKINIEGSLNLFQNAVKYKIKKVILASTGGAIYGEQEYFPADEKHKTNPLSPYGIAKLTVENYLEFFHRYYGLNYLCLRYSNVYGPRQLPKGEAGVVAVFCKKISKGEQPVINGKGTNTRDFVFVDDVVNANFKALALKKNITLNIGTGKETSINNIFGLINNYFGNKVKEKHGKEIKGEQKRSLLDNRLAKYLLKWKPMYDIKDGIGLTCKYFEKNN